MSRVLQISDTHALAPPRLVSGRLDTARLLREAVDRVLADWPRLGPIDAVVVTGDLTDEGDVDSIGLFRDQIDRLPAPVFVIPGNHDRREALRACFADAPSMPGAGPVNWAHSLPDMRLIGLDTLVEGRGGGLVDAETLAFLAAALDEAPGVPALIAMHHPPIRSGVHFMDAIGLDGTEALAEVLRRATAEVRIVCGHLHSLIVGSLGAATVVVAPSIASAIPVDYRPDAPVGFTPHPGGYMVHTWEGGFRSALVPFHDGSKPYPF